jgi:hypothetical protein
MKNLIITASTFCCIFLLATPSFGQRCTKRLSDGIVIETSTDKTTQVSTQANNTQNAVAVQPKRNDAVSGK